MTLRLIARLGALLLILAARPDAEAAGDRTASAKGTTPRKLTSTTGRQSKSSKAPSKTSSAAKSSKLRKLMTMASAEEEAAEAASGQKGGKRGASVDARIQQYDHE